MSSKRFLQQVTSYIRSKEARGYVEQELQHHLTQATQAWINKGYAPAEAEQKAIAEMGPPTQLGKAMNKIHKPKWDLWVISALLLLIVASFIPIVTVDFNAQYGPDMTRYFLENKLLHIALAVAAIALVIVVDYRKLQRYSLLLYSAGLLLLLSMLFFMPNVFVNGQAMLKLGPVHIQAWTVLPLFLIAFAGFFASDKWKLWQLTILFIVPIPFFMALPNLIVTLLYMLVVFVLFSFSLFSKKTKIAALSVVGFIGAALASLLLYAYHYVAAPYQVVRIKAFLQPELYEEGYMILQLQTALDGARWFGAGNATFLPDAHTDYALVQLIQAYGYSVGLAIILLMLVIMLRGFSLVRTMPTSFGQLLVLAAVTLYALQCLYSIAMVFGWLPITGIPLPFISYGMTPMLLNALLIGLVLSVYRRKSYARFASDGQM